MVVNATRDPGTGIMARGPSEGTGPAATIGVPAQGPGATTKKPARGYDCERNSATSTGSPRSTEATQDITTARLFRLSRPA